MKLGRIDDDNIRYIVNKEKGTVTAIYEGAENDALAYAVNTCDVPFVTGKLRDSILMDDTIVSVAKCNFEEGDEFSEEVGRKIARSKLHSKYRKMLSSALHRFTKELDRISNHVQKLPRY